jgi:SOS-response transcriptional repressor LexA
MMHRAEATPGAAADVALGDNDLSARPRQSRLPMALPLPFARSGRGEPVAAPAVAIDALSLLRGIVTDQADVFAVTARGHGMRDALVNDGDVVLVQRATDVRSGELAAVRHAGAGGLVLRRVRFEPGAVVLRAENRRIAPETVDRGDVTIEGRVIAIARRNPYRRPLAADWEGAAGSGQPMLATGEAAAG